MQQHVQHDIFAEGSEDYIFRVLTQSECKDRRKCVAGICKMLEDHSDCHPVLERMLQRKHSDAMTEKAIFLFALYTNDEFVAYVMKQPGVCRTSLSLFKHSRLPLHTSLLLDGNSTVLDYVVNCTTDYICT